MENNLSMIYPTYMSDAIKVRNLQKIYKDRYKEKYALKGIDLTIKKGTVFGLLGQNGAGKSTFINILAQLVMKTSGDVWINGYNLDKNSILCAESIGIVLQELYGDTFFTLSENMSFLSKLRGMGPQKEYIKELLDVVGLGEYQNTTLRNLSGGMKRRLLIAKAMIGRPPIIILDEPTAGVDVLLRQELWELIENLQKIGVTIVLTTHYLEEAQRLCDEIAIIHHGEVVVQDSKETLMKKYGHYTVQITLPNPLQAIPESLQSSNYQVSLMNNGKSLMFTIKKRRDFWSHIFTKLKEEQLIIQDINTQKGTLEEIFLSLTDDGGKQAEQFV